MEDEKKRKLHCNLYKLYVVQKDPLKANAAISPGMQNCWGERKMHSECTEKVGRLTLDNLRKADIPQFL